MRDRVALSGIGVISCVVVVTVAVLLLVRRPPARGTLNVGAWPAVNALLNGMSGVLLTIGYVSIRWRRVAAPMTFSVVPQGGRAGSPMVPSPRSR